MSSASLSGQNHDPELGAPLLQPGDRNNRWLGHSPRRDSSLASFVVRSADALVVGILSLNVFHATHFMMKRDPAVPESHNFFCANSSSNSIWKTLWKVCVIAIPFVMHPLTIWISGIARSTESDLRGLSFVAGWVLFEYLWVLAVGGLLSYCMAEVVVWWLMVLIVLIVMILLIVIWAATFNRPKFLRFICCMKRDGSVAEVAGRNQSTAAKELAARVARAQGAFATVIKLQKEAEDAEKRARDAAKAQEDAESEVVSAGEESSCARAALLAAEARSTEMVNAQLEAAIAMEQAYALVADDARAIAREAKSAYDRVKGRAYAARTSAGIAKDALEAAEKRVAEAPAKVLRLRLESERKDREAGEAREKTEDAFAAAKAANEEAGIARGIALL